MGGEFYSAFLSCGHTLWFLHVLSVFLSCWRSHVVVFVCVFCFLSFLAVTHIVVLACAFCCSFLFAGMGGMGGMPGGGMNDEMLNKMMR